MSNSHIAGLVDSNIHTLDAAISLLDKLTPEAFCKTQAPYFESSFGKHLRHILDHYICFRRDLQKGTIDYDQRHRDCQLETDKDYALGMVNELKQFLETIKHQHQAHEHLTVLMCNDVDLPAGQTTDSSIGRELQFLQGHSVHHFALMAVMMRLGDMVVDKNFGVAPSTIVHNETVKATA